MSPLLRARWFCGVLALSGLLLLACGGGSGASGDSSNQPPNVTSFTSSASSIKSGDHATLSWSVSGATTISIDHGIGTVTGSSVQVSPTVTTTYTLTATNSIGTKTAQYTIGIIPAGTVRIAYLHHSTGGNVWDGGVPTFFTNYNTAHSCTYQITDVTYPNTSGGYPWANYPYDYWNLWVSHTGGSRDLGELNLDDLVANYDVIVFKHCFPVSDIGPESDCTPARVDSPIQTVGNYQLQYAALKTRMKQFPAKKFIVWTGAALVQNSTNVDAATRAQTFFNWVKNTWDEKNDNIFVWDFYALETEGTLYMNTNYAANSGDSHPNAAFSQTVAPYISQRIVDVIEGKGDTGSITGH